MIVFYKLTEKQFNSFKKGDLLAVPSVNPYKLYNFTEVENMLSVNPSILDWSYSDLEEYGSERKVLKDNKLNLYYVIAELPDDIDEIDEILLDDTWDV